jgi:hypothetical protein
MQNKLARSKPKFQRKRAGIGNPRREDVEGKSQAVENVGRGR